MADRYDKSDPYRSYRFRVEIDGLERAGFRECSGLDFSQDPVDYREGPDPLNVRKLPGLVKYANLVLKWGLSDDKELGNGARRRWMARSRGRTALSSCRTMLARRRWALELHRRLAVKWDRPTLPR